MSAFVVCVSWRSCFVRHIRRRERHADGRVAQPIRIRRTDVHHGMMNILAAGRPDLRHADPFSFGEAGGHDFVRVFHVACALESAPALASALPRPVSEYSSPWSTAAAMGLRVHLPLEHLIPPTSRSSESHRLKAKGHSGNGRCADRQTKAAFCVDAQSSRPLSRTA